WAPCPWTAAWNCSPGRWTTCSAFPRSPPPPWGAVGFCMGGGFVLQLAATDPRVSAAVPFYGVIQGELPDFTGTRAEILGHYGEEDGSVPPDSLDALRAALEKQAGITPDLRLYPAGHAFFNDRRETYHAEAAAQAWESTLGFLHSRLEQTPGR
ncbi:LOW QUALITY PROTEIN: carboxymethylenebutenolidase, partial [Streptomyces sp. SPB78]